MITTYHRRARTLCFLALLGLLSAPIVRAQAAPASAPSRIAWTLTKPGHRNEVVRTLQYLLRARGFQANTDGVFGGQTQRAVAKFQRAHGLAVDGAVGDQTWKALVMPLKRGSRGYVVRALQNQLVAGGNDTPVDGIFGAKTEVAVKKFQEDYELKKDGVVGLATWNSLLEEELGD